MVLGENEKIIKIHDSYINTEEVELFYTETTRNVKWLERRQISESKYLEFIKDRKSIHEDFESCNTLKLTVTSCDIKCKTRGILLSATNCGIVMSFRELYGSESCTQVALLFMDTLDSFKGTCRFFMPIINYYTCKFINLGTQPEYMVYDDACHLMRFVNTRMKREPVSRRLKLFNDKKFVIDKLHIRGHKEAFCNKNCHPDNFPELAKANTVICEQVNYWLNNFKYILKHMNRQRYIFFLSIILREFNNIKIKGKYNIIKQVPEYKALQNKRILDEIDD
jgi:hypothetical protein